jgi:hypothetical protein
MRTKQNRLLDKYTWYIVLDYENVTVRKCSAQQLFAIHHTTYDNNDIFIFVV